MSRSIGALIFAIMSCAWLGACATQLSAPTATFDNVQRLRQAGVSPLSLGEFTRGPDLSEARDQSVIIRASSVRPPGGGTFSAYLRSVIETELSAAGKFDPGSSRVLSGQLTRSEVSTGGSTAQGALGAQFRLTRDGEVVFDQEIVVEESWPSNFIGAIAIPDATNHYTGLYPQLFEALLADPGFREAAQ